MTPQEIADDFDDLPGGSVRRREAVRVYMAMMRSAGRLEEPPHAPRVLPELPAREPQVGEWSRQRSRCDAGHGRHRAWDEARGAWHLLKACRWAYHGCCPRRGACGAKLQEYDHGNGHREYLETATTPPDGACRKCLDKHDRQQEEVAALRKLAAA